MERIIQVARETGYLEGVQDFRAVDAYGYLPPNKVVALCTGSQGEPRAALSRIAEDQHPDVTLSRGDTRDLFRAHHSRQRKGGRPRHQRADRPGHRGDHRPHPSGARVGPSAPRRAGGADRLGQPADPHPGARRGAASVRARRARPPLRRQGGRAVPQRRSGAACAFGRHHRRGAGRAALQGRLAAGRGRRAHGRRPPAPELCRRGFGRARAHRQGRAGRPIRRST